MPIRTAIVVSGDTPINHVVLGFGDEGDAYLSSFDGTQAVYDFDTDQTVTVQGCIIVEVTLEPKPVAVGVGWRYVNEDWVPPEPWVWDEEQGVLVNPEAQEVGV